MNAFEHCNALLNKFAADDELPLASKEIIHIFISSLIEDHISWTTSELLKGVSEIEQIRTRDALVDLKQRGLLVSRKTGNDTIWQLNSDILNEVYHA